MICRKRGTTSRLKHKLMLQQEVRISDDAGGYSRDWKDIAALWAEIIPMHGDERSIAGNLQADITHKILLRYREGVTADMRLLFDKRAFNIRSVINTHEKNETLELYVSEGDAA